VSFIEFMGVGDAVQYAVFSLVAVVFVLVLYVKRTVNPRLLS
jgi:hypothetical protein